MAAPPLRVWQRFHVRTTALYAVPLFAMLAVIAIVVYQREVGGEHALLRARLRALSVSLASAIDPEAVAMPAPGPPTPARQRLLDALDTVGRDQPDVVAIYVLRPDDDVGHMTFLADWDRRGLAVAPGTPYDAAPVPLLVAAARTAQVERDAVPDAWGPTLSGYAPVRDRSGRTVAIVGVDIAASTIAAREREVITRTAIAFAIATALLVVVGAVVGRRVRRPIARIVDATAAIAAGQLDTRVGLTRTDELGRLGASFDRMAAGLEERERLRSMFGRYVSEDVARAVLASPDAAQLGGELREVTVLFSDLRGYSTIVEHLAPAGVIAIVNRYLDTMATLIDDHGGCVLELLGDGILAVFGAPVARADHAAQALACAAAMQARLAELNTAWDATGAADAWRDRGLDALGMRIGIHTGRVVAGNIGGATRMKYAVLGDAVNVAARVEQLNKELATTILFTAATHAQLPPDVAARAEPRGEHPLKGRAQPVTVFTMPMGINSRA